jgi:hypothetical protein
VADPISPELALVCPELRAEAIASLPTVFVDAFLVGPRRPCPAFDGPDAARARGPGFAWEGLAPVVAQYLTLPALAVIVALLVTLALTSIADVVRP